jgi:hypothetical protein
MVPVPGSVVSLVHGTGSSSTFDENLKFFDINNNIDRNEERRNHSHHGIIIISRSISMDSDQHMDTRVLRNWLVDGSVSTTKRNNNDTTTTFHIVPSLSSFEWIILGSTVATALL